MKKLFKYLIIVSLLPTIIFAQKITLRIEEPNIINANKDSAVIIKELLKANFEKLGYFVIEDSIGEAKFIIKTKVLKIDKSRVKFIVSKIEDNAINKIAEGILYDTDLLDVFIERLVNSIETDKTLNETKEYGNVLADEQGGVLKEIKFDVKFEGSLGGHLGTIETFEPQIHYAPVYADFGWSFYKPDYFISIKTTSFFQSIGGTIGFAGIMSKRTSSFYAGAALGASYYYGFGNPVDNPYFGPNLSIYGGYMFERILSIYLKPEFKLEASYRKMSDVMSIVLSANIYLTICAF